MPKISRSDRFIKELQKLVGKGVLTIEQVEKFLRLIEENPRHPSLRIKKIQGTADIFEASVNMSIRVSFQYIKPDTVYLRNIGEHDMTLKRP
ncbi:type II toxin-antitoxin system YafQ family toxin [Anaeroselena agilis]|uniref:Cytotoxin n=1 Tax=Anaeroselena agilis TaxID=3063788 RepID=A0ABU3NVE6_9FIRM|nr:cytotoxin [Selenomonadales bacterium 4137-cl]